MPTVEILNRKRADYLHDDATKKLYRALYRGGHAIRAMAKQILPRRPAETTDLWGARLAAFHYKNLAAKVVDEFAGTVFADDLQVVIAKDGETRPELGDEYRAFLACPTGRPEDGDFTAIMFRAFIDAQIDGAAWFLPAFLDAPEAKTRQEQEKAGALRPRVHVLPDCDVLNVGEDDFGVAWVMVHHEIEDTDPLKADDERVTLHRWTLYTRKDIRRWEVSLKGKEPLKNDLEVPEVSGSGRPHRWSAMHDGRGQCPVVRMRIGDATWILDRIGSLLLEETRKRNGLGWYRELACYPQPTHTGESTIEEKRQEAPGTNTRRGAAWWLEGGKEDEFAYLEPSGGSLDHLSKALQEIAHDIAEVVYQAASSVSPAAAAQVQSAASKTRDTVAKRILAATYAEDIRNATRRVMDLVAAGRADQVVWEVIGLQVFDIDDAEVMIAEGLQVQALAIPSPTFRREYQKRLVRPLLPGASIETLEKIGQEIESAPEPGEEGDLGGADGDDETDAKE